MLLYPSFSAGTDTLTIEIPGLPLQTIPVTVNAAKAYRVSIQSADSLLPEKTLNASVLVYDRWGNSVTNPASVTVQASCSNALALIKASIYSLIRKSSGII